MIIRPAKGSDAAAVAALWNVMITQTLFTFTSQPKTGAEVAALIAGAQCSVMAHEGQISGRLDGAPKVPSDWVVKIDGRTFEVELGQGGATVDGEWIAGQAEVTDPDDLLDDL